MDRKDFLKTSAASSLALITGTGADAQPQGVLRSIDFDTKLVAVIENGMHVLYTQEGERLNYLTETVIVDKAGSKNSPECQFEMIVDGLIPMEDLPMWRVEKHETREWLYYLVSPLGRKYYFNSFFKPINKIDSTNVSIQCAVELRNEPPKEYANTK